MRLKIKLAYRGRRWGTVPLEVAPSEGEAGNDIETLKAIAIDQFGLDGLERIPCLGVRYQIAQKIHACTEPPLDGKSQNPEVIVYASWPNAYTALAVEHGFAVTDVNEAASQLREMIARIDLTRDAIQ